MNRSTFLAILMCCTPIVGALFLAWADHFARADTLETDFPPRVCQVIHAPGGPNPHVMDVPDKKTLTIKDGIVTFIDVDGNQLWVSQPFIVKVPGQVNAVRNLR